MNKVDWNKNQKCNHPGHKFPTHLVIRGEKYTHVCPACGEKTTVYNPIRYRLGIYE